MLHTWQHYLSLNNLFYRTINTMGSVCELLCTLETTRMRTVITWNNENNNHNNGLLLRRLWAWALLCQAYFRSVVLYNVLLFFHRFLLTTANRFGYPEHFFFNKIWLRSLWRCKVWRHTCLAVLLRNSRNEESSFIRSYTQSFRMSVCFTHIFPENYSYPYT